MCEDKARGLAFSAVALPAALAACAWPRARFSFSAKARWRPPRLRRARRCSLDSYPRCSATRWTPRAWWTKSARSPARRGRWGTQSGWTRACRDAETTPSGVDGKRRINYAGFPPIVGRGVQHPRGAGVPFSRASRGEARDGGARRARTRRAARRRTGRVAPRAPTSVEARRRVDTRDSLATRTDFTKSYVWRLNSRTRRRRKSSARSVSRPRDPSRQGGRRRRRQDARSRAVSTRAKSVRHARGQGEESRVR